MKHRVAATLALALCLLACTGDVRLLAGGGETCSVGGIVPMSIVGVLIADPRSGTAIKMDPSQTAWREVFAETMVPVAWPAGFTARRRGLEVEVLRAGEVVVTTGTHVVLSTAFEDSPVHSGIFPACDGKQLPPD